MPTAQLGTFLRSLCRRRGIPPGGLSDARLLERWLDARDEAAFELLVWRHGPAVLGLCRRLLADAHDVEDAFQATFLALVRKAGSIGRQEAVGGWLYRVAYRVALRARAASARRRRETALPELPAPPAPDDLAWRDLRPVLDEEVERLPGRLRSAFVLCCVEGLSQEEAAGRLGCAPGTVSSRLTRARQWLRRRLARRGIAPAALAA